jgi:hypothetical protein
MRLSRISLPHNADTRHEGPGRAQTAAVTRDYTKRGSGS